MEYASIFLEKFEKFFSPSTQGGKKVTVTLLLKPANNETGS